MFNTTFITVTIVSTTVKQGEGFGFGQRCKNNHSLKKN